eukprot:TRINITY_DN63058_c0_g1_i1.p1 TRINITY_DN63058_c0_g1~~TRINITY_DN63058_c0_g1_i1.p1  ORF type:complete len:496 (+),score=75.74 TRINITY_DN63058_c0_g1_i1:39-1526(+)
MASPMRADVARFAAGHAGFPLAGDAVVAELAPVLELKLRETLRFALRLARTARRHQLLCTDVADATESFCASEATLTQGAAHTGDAGLWSELFSRCRTAFGKSNVVSVNGGATKPLPSVPEDLHLKVEWLSVGGGVVPKLDNSVKSVPSVGWGGSGNGIPHRAENNASINSLTVVSPSPVLLEEHFALARRISSVLEGVPPAAQLRPTVVRLCGRPELAPLRPLVAHLVLRRIDASRAAGTTLEESHFLLAVLEVLSLVPSAAESYLQHCIAGAFSLCLSPAFVDEVPGDIVSGTTLAARCVNKSLTHRDHASCDGNFRRRAATFIGMVARRYENEVPELRAELSDAFGHILRRKPPSYVAAGAVFGIASLGPKCIEFELLPALSDGCLSHLTAFDPETIVQEPVAKRAKTCAKAQTQLSTRRLRVPSSDLVDALLFAAKVEASSTSDSARPLTPSPTVVLQEAVAALTGSESGVFVSHGIIGSSRRERVLFPCL